MSRNVALRRAKADHELDVMGLGEMNLVAAAWVTLLLLSICNTVNGAILSAGNTLRDSTAWQLHVADDADAAVFQSGTIPVDADGQPVHAHEGQILVQDDGPYLWYGTGQKQEVDGQWLSDSVHLYSSWDMQSWRSKGTVFQASSIPALPSAPPPYRIGAAKALYNSARRQYVLVLSVGTANGSLWAVGYASSVSPYGPFKWEPAALAGLAPGGELGVAEDDGNKGGAYLVRSVGANNLTEISRLRDDYLGTTGVCNTAPSVGAPALFKRGGRWYLLGSRHKEWRPAPPLLFVSNGSSLCSAAWTKLPQPAAGPGADTAFDSTPAFVHAHRWADGRELHVYVGDRWNAGGEGGVGNASYVWLPLLPVTGSDPLAFKLLWLDSWRLGDFRPLPPS